MPGTLALGATKGITKEKAMKDNLLKFEDLENLKLAEDLAKTCFEMYSVTSTGIAPEIAYFHTKVGWIYNVRLLEILLDHSCLLWHHNVFLSFFSIFICVCSAII